jgi:hypothetical protein
MVFIEKCAKTVAFTGMLIFDTVVTIGVLLPISIIELTINKELGTYNTIEKLWNFTVKVGTSD